MLAGTGEIRLRPYFSAPYIWQLRQAAFFQVLLMIVFGGPEGLGGGYFGHDGPGEALLRSFAGGLRFRFLLGRMEEDGAAVLGAYVRALAVQRGRVVIVPEDFQQVVVADHRGIERYFDYFGVAGAVGADVFVRRVVEFAAGVADLRRFHAC